MKKSRRLLDLVVVVGLIAVVFTFSRNANHSPIRNPILTIEKNAADDGWAVFKLAIYRKPNFSYSASYGVLPMWGEPVWTTEDGQLTSAQMQNLLMLLKPREVKRSWGTLIVRDGTLPTRSLDLTDWSRLKKSWVGELRSRLEKRGNAAPWQERNGDAELPL